MRIEGAYRVKEIKNDDEKLLLQTLAWVCNQYMTGYGDTLDSHCMGAGEEAFKLLSNYGLMQVHEGRSDLRYVDWTSLGREFLEAH